MRRSILQAIIGGLLLAVAVTLVLCIPTDESAKDHSRAAARAGAVRPCKPIVDLSSPRATLCSYLDSYEKRCHEGMYLCMSQRLRRCCGCSNCVEFCSMMQSVPQRRQGDEIVLKYYRSLVPAIEQRFSGLAHGADRFEVVFADSPRSEHLGRPSRLVFVEEDGAWRMDVFEVYVPAAGKPD